MTKIVLKASSDLGEAIQDAEGLLGFLTLRDTTGRIVWSHRITQWSIDKVRVGDDDMSVYTQSVQDIIEGDLEARRDLIEHEYRRKGLL